MQQSATKNRDETEQEKLEQKSQQQLEEQMKTINLLAAEIAKKKVNWTKFKKRRKHLRRKVVNFLHFIK